MPRIRHTHVTLLKQMLKSRYRYWIAESAKRHSIQPLNRVPNRGFQQNLMDWYWFFKLVETSVCYFFPIPETGGDGLKPSFHSLLSGRLLSVGQQSGKYWRSRRPPNTHNFHGPPIWLSILAFLAFELCRSFNSTSTVGCTVRPMSCI